MTAIYTAVMGGYDDLPPHPDIPGVEFIAFTDTPQESDFWDVQLVAPQDVHPRMAAKFFKVFPNLVLPEHEHTVWIDSSHEISTPDFAVLTISSIGESNMALFEHPWRTCIYDEAKASLPLKKYKGEPIEEQIASYRAEGHPKKWGLFACGTLARRQCASVDRLMAAWWDEITAWSYQDQLSLPVVCRRQGVRPETFPIHQVNGNRWHTIRPHHRED